MVAVFADVAVVMRIRAVRLRSMSALALVAEWNTLEECVFNFAAVAPEDESSFDE